MKRILLIASAIFCTAAWLATPVLAGDDHDHAMAEGGEDAMMAKWMELATPGPHHEMMAKSVGKWMTESTFWMTPDAEPMVSKGTASQELALGGRYLMETYSGTMMGMPFEGHGMWGYDNASGKHMGIWTDNMSTTMMYSEGGCEDHCNKITLIGTYVDGMTGAMKTSKVVSEVIDDDHASVTMYEVMEDGTEFKNGVIMYTRVKS